MIEAADNPRDKAIIAVLYDSAMRAGEFLSLKVKNVSFDRYGAIILLPRNQTGMKTGSRRIRLIDVAPYLQAWINNYPKKDDPDTPLWPSRVKKNLRMTQFAAIVKHCAMKAEIKKQVHPHLFRHLRLTHLAKMPWINEMDLRIIAGWTRSSNMPAVYLHLSGRDVDRKLLEHRGLLEEEETLKEEEQPLKPQKCPRCGTVNTADAKFCHNCSMALSLKAVKEVERERARVHGLLDVLFQDPDVRELTERKLRELKKEGKI